MHVLITSFFFARRPATLVSGYIGLPRDASFVPGLLNFLVFENSDAIAT